MLLKRKNYAQELVLETAAPQMTIMQMPSVDISLLSHRSQEKTMCTSCEYEYIIKIYEHLPIIKI